MDHDVADPAADDCRYLQSVIRPAGRVMFCGRCGHAAAGSQGHYTAWCGRDRTMTDHHFCCLTSCERHDGEAMDPLAPCHPAPGTHEQWAADLDARRAR